MALKLVKATHLHAYAASLSLEDGEALMAACDLAILTGARVEVTGEVYAAMLGLEERLPGRSAAEAQQYEDRLNVIIPPA